MSDIAALRPRKNLRARLAILAVIALSLALGLKWFYSRQSLVTSFQPYQVTRVIVPAALLQVKAPPASRRPAHGVPVLVYHGIVPEGETGNVTPETFRAHMVALKKAGYTTLALDEFRAFIEDGGRVPERSVLVTFDDGRTDSFSGADPVLKRLGFKATMFTILGHAATGKSFYLTFDETEMMDDTGRWDVQSHTAYSHVFKPVNSIGDVGRPLPSRLWNAELERLESDEEYVERVRSDLELARDGIERLTERPVYAFAYPWGDRGQESEDPLIRRELPRIAGSIYPLTFVQASPTLDETYNYPFEKGAILRRIYISHDMTAEKLMARIERGVPKSVPFEDEKSFASSGWSLTVGSLAPEASGRSLASAVDGGRGEAFLDGSRAWTDYEVASSFALETSETVSLIVRRAGPRDYVAATISPTYVSFERVLGDERTVIAEADVALAHDGVEPVDAKVRAVADRVTLQLDGADVLQARGLPRVLARGGVAVRVDPAEERRSTLWLERFAVRPIDASLASRPRDTTETN